MANLTGHGGKREGAGGKRRFKSKSPGVNVWMPSEYKNLVLRYIKEIDEKRYGKKEVTTKKSA